MTLVLFGKMASGKTTTANILEKNYGYKRAVTDTTRTMRPGETNGVDYNFVTEEEFRQNEALGVYAETAVYHAVFGTVHYGSRADIFMNNGKSVIVLNPRGLRAVRDKGFACKAIYLRAKDDTLLDRLAIRGDDKEEIDRRLAEDAPDFADACDICDYVVDVDGLTPEEVCQRVLALLASESGKFKREEERDRYRQRRKHTAKHKVAMKKQSTHLRKFDAPAITEDGEYRHKHRSDAEKFCKTEANRKTRRLAKVDINAVEQLNVEEESGTCSPSKGNQHRKEYDIGWSLY